LLQLQPRSSAADEQAEASYERLQQFLVKMRERRRRVRRQFLAREQSFTDSLVLGRRSRSGAADHCPTGSSTPKCLGLADWLASKSSGRTSRFIGQRRTVP
jgi:hypothetical protein